MPKIIHNIKVALDKMMGLVNKPTIIPLSIQWFKEYDQTKIDFALMQKMEVAKMFIDMFAI